MFCYRKITRFPLIRFLLWEKLIAITKQTKFQEKKGQNVKSLINQRKTNQKTSIMKIPTVKLDICLPSYKDFFNKEIERENNCFRNYKLDLGSVCLIGNLKYYYNVNIVFKNAFYFSQSGGIRKYLLEVSVCFRTYDINRDYIKPFQQALSQSIYSEIRKFFNKGNLIYKDDYYFSEEEILQFMNNPYLDEKFQFKTTETDEGI